MTRYRLAAILAVCLALTGYVVGALSMAAIDDMMARRAANAIERILK